MDGLLPTPTTLTTSVLPIYEATTSSTTTAPVPAISIATTSDDTASLGRRDSEVSLGSDASGGGSVVNGMGKEMDLLPIFED